MHQLGGIHPYGCSSPEDCLPALQIAMHKWCTCTCTAHYFRSGVVAVHHDLSVLQQFLKGPQPKRYGQQFKCHDLLIAATTKVAQYVFTWGHMCPSYLAIEEKHCACQNGQTAMLQSNERTSVTCSAPSCGGEPLASPNRCATDFSQDVQSCRSASFRFST